MSEKRCLNCGYSMPSYVKFCTNCGSASLETVVPYYPPPPPPKSVPSKTRKGGPTKKIALGIATALIIVTLIIASIFVFPGIFPFFQQNGGSGGSSQLQGDVFMTTGTSHAAVETTIGSAGGTVSVTDMSNPVYGLKIEFPEGSTRENVEVAISYAEVTEITGLPENFSVAGKLIKIETSGSAEWDETKYFEAPVLVTLPYDSSLASSESAVRFYVYDRDHHTLDSAGFIEENPTEHTVSFYTSSFSDYFPVKWTDLDYWRSVPTEVDTGFRPVQNGWFMPNMGSYVEPMGCCLGMVNYAKWFYRQKTVDNWQEVEGIGGWNIVGPNLYDKYREGDLNKWLDDATAIQLATRAQLAAVQVTRRMHDLKQYAVANLSDPGRSGSYNVAMTWLHGMKVTHEPQLVTLKTQFADGNLSGGHAVLTYRFSNGRFDIYDPNFPASSPNTDARQIPYTKEGGFSRSYVSAINPAAADTQFNFFLAFGWKVFASQSFYEGLYESAEKKFTDDNRFPEVSLTSENTSPEGTTPEDTDGDGMRDTNKQKVTISGTMNGGYEERIGDGWVFVAGNQFPVIVLGQYPEYTFSVEVPLYQGDNEVIFIGSYNLRHNWAGFLKDTIRSNATKTHMAVTLTWQQDDSDVDLHVLEPTIGDTEGRHIYYSNPGGYAGGLHPYLDIDDRGGLGPEHYYAAENMTLPNYEGSGTFLYGVYKIRVQYYRDKDADDNHTQTINWYLNVKILAFRIEQTGEEFWIEKSLSGVLSTENAYGTSDFFNSDGSWSAILEIEYPELNPSDYNIPPPPQNQLPE